MDPVERLLAIEDIKQLKARYLRGMDTKEWDVFDAVWTDDAIFDFRLAYGQEVPENILNGRKAIVDYLKRSTVAMTTVHQCHMPEIEILTPTTARGIWALEDCHMTQPEAKAVFKRLQGFAYYHEEYRRTGEGWKVSHARVVRHMIQAFET